jgi:GT2 family glycosyltransferase
VLIATHGRRELLRRCLGSLREQTAPPGSFEVLVADDGSTDGTAEMVERFEAPFELRVARLEKAGKAAALNAVLGAARGAACLFLDDDTIASAELVAGHLAAHREDPGTLAIGRLVQSEPPAGDAYARAAAERWNERYEALASGEPDWADCYGANFSAPRATLVEIGGFATDLPAVEDIEVAFRLGRAGCAVRYLPRASAVHDDSKPGARVLADERRYGAVCVELARRHPEARRRLLGWFAESSPREVRLRRALLALRVPPRPLAAAARLLPTAAPRRLWLDFVSRYAFWHGVHSALSGPDWRRTTDPSAP